MPDRRTNPWVLDECWKCDRLRRVKFVGPCDLDLGSGAVHLCEPCQRRWADRVHQALNYRPGQH